MKSKIAVILSIIALATSIAWTVNAQKQRPEKTSWEYKIEMNPDERRLNELGLQGWEMAGVNVDITDGSSRNAVVYMKRAR